MEPQDELAGRVLAYVRTQVALEEVEVVTRTVLMTVSTLMQDRRFFEALPPVQQLIAQVQWLHNENLVLKETLSQLGLNGTAVRKGPVRKTPAKKRAAPRVKGGTAAQRKAFRNGYSS